MNKSEARDLRFVMSAALREVGDSFGMDIKVKSISYGSDNFHCKIEGLTRGAESLEAQYYRRVAPDEMPKLGAKVLLLGTEYTVVGWKSRASKFPVLIKDNSGVEYKVSTRQLLSATILD